jgi:hypothetical protein
MRGLLVYAAEHRDRWVAVAMPWERRGDFARLWRVLGQREDAPVPSPAWRRVRRRTVEHDHALVEVIAACPWITVTTGRLPAAPRLLVRVEDEAAAAPLARRRPQVRVVDRRQTPGLQLARLVARALGTPKRRMRPAQRSLARSWRRALDL